MFVFVIVSVRVRVRVCVRDSARARMYVCMCERERESKRVIMIKKRMCLSIVSRAPLQTNAIAIIMLRLLSSPLITRRYAGG